MSWCINIFSISIIKIENIRKARIKFYSIMNIKAILRAKFLNFISNRIFIFSLYLLIQAIFFNRLILYYFSYLSIFTPKLLIRLLIRNAQISVSSNSLLQFQAFKMRYLKRTLFYSYFELMNWFHIIHKLY